MQGAKMRFGAVVASCGLASCAFQRSGNVDVEPDGTPGCAAPIIDDSFDNTDLATVGSLSVGMGFSAVTNANSGNGISAEPAGRGLEIRTANNNPPQAPTQGVVSNTSFSFNSTGMTVRLEVSEASTPIWNGIALALQSNPSDIDRAGGSLVLRIRGQGTNSFHVDLGNQMTYQTPISSQPYDESALADGFVVSWTLGANSWSYVVDGLRVDGSPIMDSGSYPTSESPADLFGGPLYLGVHIQGNPSDTTSRILRATRVTVRCP